MSQTDPIADLIVRIKNASRVKKDTLECPSSVILLNMCEIFKREGFIKDVRQMKDNKQGLLRIYLKYGKDKSPAITGIKRVSKPGRRIYKKMVQVPKILGGMGVAIVSTPKGILTDTECRDNLVGGEVLCYIW